MKTLIHHTLFTAIIVLCSFNSGSAGNHAKADTSRKQVCLEVLGIALDADDKPIDGVEVKLFKENDETEWSEITSVMHHDHSFDFKLESNEYYTIEISKPGYVTRSIGISTKIPATVSLKDMFHYEFEVNLFREKKEANDYYLDFPVALISYDAKRDVFDYNSNYTKHIKTMIEQNTGEASNRVIYK